MQITSTASKKMLVAFTIGSIFEIFDFLSFIFLAPIIAALFFPQHIYAMATLFTYVTIAVSYLLRPIGDFIVAQRALGRLEADAQEERIRSRGERAATECFCRKNCREFRNRKRGELLTDALKLHAFGENERKVALYRRIL